MKAARWFGPGQIQLVSQPDPRPASDEALVAVRWVGLCGSDADEYLHGPVVARPPVTLGHEIVGVVEKPAADGSGPTAGTPVVVDVVTGCGRCFWCLRHEEGLCPALVVSGLHVDGGLAQYVTGRAERLVPVPEGLDLRSAALAEPLAVAVRAVRKVGAVLGRGVLVTGGGTIGILTAQVARTQSAGPVVVVEPAEHRRRLLSTFDLQTVWAGEGAHRRSALNEIFPERGIDLVFECSGRTGVPAEAAELVRAGGTVVLLGVTPHLESIDTLGLVLGEKIVRGSAAHMYDDDVAVAVSMLASGAIDVSGLVTHTFALDEVDSAFRTLTDPHQQAVKVLVAV